MERSNLKYILDILQGLKLEEEITDWYSVLGFLELNKVSGYFYNRIKETEVKIPQNINRKLNNIVNIQTERNKQMCEWIEKISKQAENTGLKYAFLKGSLLNNANLKLPKMDKDDVIKYPRLSTYWEYYKTLTFYRDGERVSNDIDILIKPKDITEITKLLKGMGFVQGYYDFTNNRIVELDRKEIIMRRMNRGETAPFLKQLDSAVLPFIEVDLNFSIDYLPTGNEQLLNTMLDNTILYESALKSNIRSLTPEHFLTHLIMHQYKESVVYSMVMRNKDLELYKLLDIYIFLTNEIIDKGKFIKTVDENNLNKPCIHVLQTVSELFNQLSINSLIKELNPGNENFTEAVIDPENKDKKYIWTKNVLERLLCFNKANFLSEAKDE
jgi:hypothetical protein